MRQDPRIAVRDGDLFIDARTEVPSPIYSWGTPAQQELWNFIQERRITHLLYIGDATNMCVITRAYGMIQMCRLGVNTVIVRDLTNAMTFDGYNPDTRKLDPAVTPAVGTAKSVEYIEKMIGPSLDSQQIKDIARRVTAKKNASGKVGFAPFTDADVARIAALPAVEQVEEVRKELMRRNPGFDGTVEHKIEDGVVTEIKVVTDKVTDISPIRVFNALKVLDCSGTHSSDWTRGNGQLADLTPLKGMNLANLIILDLDFTKVDDAGMAYFKESKGLWKLSLKHTRVSDSGMHHFKDCTNLGALDLLLCRQITDAGLAHFQDCRELIQLWLDDCGQFTGKGLAYFKDCKNLTELHMANTQVGDAGLANLKGLLLKVLTMPSTSITDLTPLQGMPLEDIRLTPKKITRFPLRSGSLGQRD
jgi:hypothetical protein